MGVVHTCGWIVSCSVGYRVSALFPDRPHNVCCDPAFSEAFERLWSDEHVFRTSFRAFLSIASLCNVSSVRPHLLTMRLWLSTMPLNRASRLCLLLKHASQAQLFTTPPKRASRTCLSIMPLKHASQSCLPNMPLDQASSQCYTTWQNISI
jgi:hypothetical protein